MIARTALFVLFGSALWALLPVVTVQQPGPRRVGVRAADGVHRRRGRGGRRGAAAAAAALGYNGLTAAGSLVLAGVLAALTVVTSPLVAAAVLVVAGVAWIAVVTSLLTAAQLVAPAWVRGRALAAWLLAFQLGLRRRRRALGPRRGRVAATPRCWSRRSRSSRRSLLGRVFALPAGEGPAPEPAGNWEDPVVAADLERRRRARPRRHRVRGRRGARTRRSSPR